MAEVFLGMQGGLGGFEKLVVVKRIFPQFCEDENFVRMFLDEARLAASIRHQNVVQILDIARDEEGFFIVMEYLSGETVAYLFEALRARNEQIPPHVVCRIGAEIAAGLHHAHTATDAAGNPQPIVHRDVTPSNLLVCFNGVVKVVDFGVAKATLTDGHTQVGALKGKMSYLSPEQVEDLPVDGRTDVFQLGICLHEMLTGQRLFRGQNDHQKMLAVMEKPIPRPSEIVPAVPPPLDDLVLWALERDPARRPQTADALRRELENVLKEIGLTVSDHDLGEWMERTFPERKQERLKMERSCVSQMRDRQSNAGVVATSSPSLQVPAPASPEGSGQRTPTMATVLQRQAKQSGTASTSIVTPRQGWFIAAVLVFFIAGVSVSAWKLGGPEEATAAHERDRQESSEGRSGEEDAPIDVAALEESSSSELSSQEATAGEETASAPEEAGSAPEEGRDAEPARAEETEAPEKAKEPAEPDTFSVEVEVVPEDASIALDGEEVAVGSLREVLPMDGTEHRLRITADGYQPETIRFTDEPPEEVIRLRRERRPRRPVRQPAGGESLPDEPEEPEAKAPPEDDGREEPRRPQTDNLDPWAD